MLFARRHKPDIFHHVKNFFWPRIGWRRSIFYLIHRLRRMQGTPYAIAAGFACGAAVSFTPFIGFHFAMAALMAWIIGGNLMASAIGTVVGNPWTFPFIWLWSYQLGNAILGTNGSELPAELGFTFIFDHPGQVLLPMVVGGIPSGIVAWFVSYWPLKRMIESYHHIRAHRRRARARRHGVRS